MKTHINRQRDHEFRAIMQRKWKGVPKMAAITTFEM
jgi:hypothetical protein